MAKRKILDLIVCVYFAFSFFFASVSCVFILDQHFMLRVLLLAYGNCVYLVNLDWNDFDFWQQKERKKKKTPKNITDFQMKVEVDCWQADFQAMKQTKIFWLLVFFPSEDVRPLLFVRWSILWFFVFLFWNLFENRNEWSLW